MTVRPARREDSAELLELMIRLSRFEEYDADFVVTQADVLRYGFGPAALFKAIVAEQDGELVGMAVTYVVPWTYTMRPKLVLKELFVTRNARGFGVGRALFTEVVRYAKTLNADRIDWTVMDGNKNAEAFYSAQGGRSDQKWNNWVLDLSGE